MRSEKGIKITETIFDEEIAQLEKRRAEVETERQMLLGGQILITGPDGTSKMKIDLGALSAASSDQKTVERNLRQTLVENPLVPVLDNSFKKTRELREEMRGGTEAQGTGPRSALVNVIKANQRFNQAIRRKHRGVGIYVASPWLLLLGTIILLAWCGGPLFYAISGGNLGGNQLDTPVPTIGRTPASSPNILPTPSTRAAGSGWKDLNFSSTQILATSPVKVQLEQLDLPSLTPTPPQVGNPPSSAGGFNGPHGAFLAPSRLTVPALALDTPVERAISQDNQTSGLSEISWPRPGEVVQAGAYPGEIGNMLIMGNQNDLGALRRVQQNDEVTVYDRKGTAFIYRFLAFSPSGETERIVDPNSIDDAWVFAPTKEAILTILLTYPQPLPAVDPNKTGNNQVTPRDDYLVQKKLAYRAVLAMYAPAKITPAGTSVIVPDEVWQTVGAPAQAEVATTQNATTPVPTGETGAAGAGTTAASGSNSLAPSTATPTTPTVKIPTGFPATGGGGASKPIVKAGRFSER